MTACLKEKSLIVRRTTLTTIINLLQEDYLKLTGSLFFRILQTLSDESEEIFNLTTFYIQQRLLKRKPKVILLHLSCHSSAFAVLLSVLNYNVKYIAYVERR